MEATTLERWWPVTYDFGLVRSDIARVAATRRKAYEDAGLELRTAWLEGSLEDCFSTLEPLGPAHEKELFLATSFGWTAYFANGHRGSDPFPPMSQLSRTLGVTALRACATPESALFHAVILEVYDTPEAGGDEYGYRRSIAAANDGGRWVFDQSDTPYPFEDCYRYEARRKRDRFTPEMLAGYLEGLGIPAVSDETLQPGGSARSFLIVRPSPVGLPRFSLGAAKALQP